MNGTQTILRVSYPTEPNVNSHVISSAFRGATYRITMQVNSPSAPESSAVTIVAGALRCLQMYYYILSSFRERVAS